jgi:hypothetical protein
VLDKAARQESIMPCSSKRSSLLLLPCFLVLFFLNARAAQEIGLEAGYGLSKPTTPYYGLWQYFDGGIIGGINYDLVINDSVSYQFGLSYVQKGGKDKLEGVDFSNQTVDLGWSVFRFDYLRFPVLFKYRNPRPKLFRPSFIIGPGLDVWIHYEHHLQLNRLSSPLAAYSICYPSGTGLSSAVLFATIGMELEPFFMYRFGSTIRISADVDVTSFTRTDYNGKFSIDMTAGFVYRPEKK